MSAAESPSGPTGPVATILEAVVRQFCVSATYNRKRMILAPHIVYFRGEALYADALVVSRENMLAREPRIGTFKIDGLTELTLTRRNFEQSPLFDPTLDKYVGTTLMAIDPQDQAA